MYSNYSGAEHYFTPRPRSRLGFKLIHAYLRGRRFQFLTSKSVFSKNCVDLGTKILVEHMILPEKGYVLDMGCGYGVIGIVAAALNPNIHVIMVDINRRAVNLAKHNIKINRVNNAEARCGNLYEPVKGMVFECILSNPPISAGMATVRAIVVEAPKYMSEGGMFQVVVRSKIGKERFTRMLNEVFGNSMVLARESGYRVLMAEKKSMP
ncbi:MAG: methyltransferase [Candidatus Bathyarchaeota archaeon]|nr:methyltransferase [Candidatus Bathyarchaeota archaeon]